MFLHSIARAGLVASLLVGLAGNAAALTLTSDEFKHPRRPPVAFDHDGHNERAGLDDNCVVCHHGGENGVIDPETSSEGVPCADCHKADAPRGTTPLMRAYHQQCILCHVETNKGPSTCGGCHK